jgi:hypothetical protein
MNLDETSCLSDQLEFLKSQNRALQRLVNDTRDSLSLMTTRAEEAEAALERVWDYVQGIDGEEGVFTIQGHLTNVLENYKMPKETP